MTFSWDASTSALVCGYCAVSFCFSGDSCLSFFSILVLSDRQQRSEACWTRLQLTWGVSLVQEIHQWFDVPHTSLSDETKCPSQSVAYLVFQICFFEFLLNQMVFNTMKCLNMKFSIRQIYIWMSTTWIENYHRSCFYLSFSPFFIAFSLLGQFQPLILCFQQSISISYLF